MDAELSKKVKQIADGLETLNERVAELIRLLQIGCIAEALAADPLIEIQTLKLEDIPDPLPIHKPDMDKERVT